jgi:pyridoxal phosphate enzyme (YggS family)
VDHCVADEGEYARQVSARLAVIRERIASAGGDPEQVTVVAVTKGQPLAAVEAALAAGLVDIGENYAEELLAKSDSLAATGDSVARPHWHYLGAIQRRKVPRLAPVVECWQAVSRAAEAETIASRAAASRSQPSGRPQIFVEVDLSGSPTRHGAPPDEVPDLVERALAAGCDVRGLMTVAPLPPAAIACMHESGQSPLADAATQQQLAAEAFGKVALLASSLGLRELSMGMSHDLEAAVAAGSTMVRIGTALFGERASR